MVNPGSQKSIWRWLFPLLSFLALLCAIIFIPGTQDDSRLLVSKKLSTRVATIGLGRGMVGMDTYDGSSYSFAVVQVFREGPKGLELRGPDIKWVKDDDSVCKAAGSDTIIFVKKNGDRDWWLIDTTLDKPKPAKR